RLKQLGAGLTPNSSALVAVIEHRWVAEVERQLAQQGADLATQALSDDIARQLKSGEDVVYTVVDTGDTVLAERSTQVGDMAATGKQSTAGTSVSTDETPTVGGQGPSRQDISGAGPVPPQTDEQAPGPSTQV